MSEHLLYVGTYAVQEGTFDAFNAANKEMGEFQVAGSRLKKGVRMVQTKRIELHGKASDRLLEQLRRISDMSGSWPVIVKSHLYGFPDWGAGARWMGIREGRQLPASTGSRWEGTCLGRLKRPRH